MTTTFPTSIDSLPRPGSSAYMDDSGFEGDLVIDNISDAIEAVERYVQKNSRRNRLYNGEMRVSQRITIGSTDNSYTLDRWRLLLEAANAATAAQETSDVPTDGSKRALALTVGSANNNKFGIFQVLEFADCADMRGKPAVVQAKLKATAGITDVRIGIAQFTGTADAVSGDPVSAWGTAGTNPTLATNWAFVGTPVQQVVTTSWATYKVENSGNVGTSANNLAVLIWCDDKVTTTTTDILRVTDVQLEEGPACSDVERRAYTEELGLCWRYCQILDVDTATDQIAAGQCYATTAAVVPVRLPVRMAATPTLTVSSAGHFSVWNSAATPVTATNVTINRATPDVVGLEITVASGLVAGDATLLVANNLSAKLQFTAEL